MQATVQSGQLPLHIEYTIPDVASFFKKILNGFPGGLLGSLELFEAMRGIFLHLASNSEQTEYEVQETRAKLIALAVLSIRSEHRIHLIQAVLGLFAILGKEAEVAQEKLHATQGSVQGKKIPSELMGYQSLGVCLGPLLIADLIDNLGTSEETNQKTPRASAEISDKAKKKRLSLVPDKLEKNADLETSIERANLTVTIMQSLLMIWQRVVKQLSILTGPEKANGASKNNVRPKYSTGRMSSGHSLDFSDGELELIKNKRELQGRISANEDLEYVVKRKVKTRTRCSLPRLVVPASVVNASQTRHISNDVDQPIAPKEAAGSTKSNGKPLPHPFRHSSSNKSPTAETVDTQLNPSTETEELHLDAGMRLMSMGQVLPSRDSIPVRQCSSSASSYRSQYDPGVKTPREAVPLCLCGTPETAFKDPGRSKTNTVPDINCRLPFNDKPLPPLKDSSPKPKPKPDLKAKQDLVSHGSSSTIGGSPKESQHLLPDRSAAVASNLRTADSDSEVATPEYEPKKSKQEENSRTATGSHFQDSAPEATAQRPHILPTVHALVERLPTRIDPLDDPFTTLWTSESPKESLIPKPVGYVGRGRQATPRTPSPPKLARSPKRQSGTSATFDEHLGIVHPRKATGTKSASFESEGHHRKVGDDQAPTRHLSVYTLESLNRTKMAIELPLTAQHVSAARLHDRPHSESPSAAPGNHQEPADSQVALVRRSGSVHATLYAEITRLKKQLEQKNDEILATKRSLDAARDTREDASLNHPSKRGSWNKGTLSAEVRDVSRDRDIWRKRAEWAERRLQGLGSLAKAVAGERTADSSQEWFEADTRNQKDTQYASEDDHEPDETASVLLLDDCNNLCGLEKTAYCDRRQSITIS